ncbi:asparagine synthase-related protein [Bradyrhizobium sp. WU425]|uniref:asparagine synthase-related protein n=1 Tax=Bradyrhizobium sp. WU425 TaxID=187029 RepID=UPI00404A707C
MLATSAWRKGIVHDAGPIDLMINAYHSGGATPVERKMLFLVRRHLPALLEMVDNTTMAAGVESRVPFADHPMEVPLLLVQRDVPDHLSC